MKKILIGTLLLSTSLSTQAVIINGGFETGALDPWSSWGSVNVSTGKSYGSAGTVAPSDGSYAANLITSGVSAATIASIMGVSESTLEASNGGKNATNGSLISQSTFATAGDTFDFNWNFVEQDYVPYDDWAFYGISFNGGATNITKFASLATVGPGSGSTVNGWETLTVDITQTGNYTFYFGIVNALDTELNSELWIDGITGTGSLNNGTIPEPSSIALLGLGLASFGFAGHRKAKR